MVDAEFERKARENVKDVAKASQDAYREKAGKVQKALENIKAFHNWLISKTK